MHLLAAHYLLTVHVAFLNSTCHCTQLPCTVCGSENDTALHGLSATFEDHPN